MHYKTFSMFTFAILAMIAAPAYAAEFRIAVGTSTLDVGAVLEARVLIDTQGEDINAFEGVVTFPSDLFKPLEVRRGGGLVNFWIEEPRIEASGEVRFSGITPGGFTGHGQLFSLVFQTKQQGSGTIVVESGRALRDDGAGSSAHATSIGDSIVVSSSLASSGVIPEIVDADPPEPFTPVVARDPTLFDGKYFLAFATQDKGSGVDHYEVCEGIFRECVTAKSPYLLQHQNVDWKIIVRAVDRAGNVRTAAYPALMHLPWYQGLVLLVIMSVFMYALFHWRRLVW